MIRYAARLLATLIVVIPPAPLIGTPSEPFEIHRLLHSGRRVLRPAIVPPVTAPMTLVSSRTSPLVAVRVTFHVGSAHDPPGKEGLAALTAGLVFRGGTRGSSFQQIQERLYPIAGCLRVESGKEQTTFSGEVHRDNFDRLVSILSSMVIMPRLDEDDWTQLRNETLARLERPPQERRDFIRLASDRMESELFRDHPLGHPPEGLRDSVRSVTREDVVRFYREHYNRDTLHVGLAGAIRPNFIDALRSQLGGLPPSPSKRSYQLERITRRSDFEVIVQEANCDSPVLALGFPIDTTGTEWDEETIILAYNFLNASFVRPNPILRMASMEPLTSPLFWSGEFLPPDLPDAVVEALRPPDPRSSRHFCLVWQVDQPQNSVESLALLLDRLGRLSREGLSSETITSLREAHRTITRLRWRSLADRLALAMDSEHLNGGTDNRSSGHDSLAAEIDPGYVNEAIRRQLAPEGLTVVVLTAHAREVATMFERSNERLSATMPRRSSDGAERRLRIRVLSRTSAAGVSRR